MRVLLACGGTGGHVFPAFSLAEELLRRDPSAVVHYACGDKDIETLIFRIVSGRAVSTVTSAPFRGLRSAADPGFWRRLGKGFLQARRLIRDVRPDVVVGFGGHYSFPVAAAARCARVPVVIHEQNAVPGMANRLLARWADGVALSHAQTAPLVPTRARVRVTGNPIRSAIGTVPRSEALAYFGFDASRRTVLVLGGSQGSQSINAVLIPALERAGAGALGRLQVLHLCGKMRSEDAQSALESAGVKARAFSFFDRMELAYAAADAAIGRAGATFLAELAACPVEALLVPYPFAGGHQMANARAFAARHRAQIVEQSDLGPEVVADFLSRVSRMPGSAQPPAGAPSARGLLADFVTELALERGRNRT